MHIRTIRARQILDSRGNPTIEVDVHIDAGLARGSVPSGASTGTHEALELRDGKSAYHGKSVHKAVNHINNIIAPKLTGLDCTRQEEIDRLMISLDGTDNKRRLGANAILGVSIAVCKAGAMAKQQMWYEYIQKTYKQFNEGVSHATVLPVPFMNVLNGGKHAGNALPFQEFMIAPVGARSITEAVQMGAEVYQELKTIIKKQYGIDAVNVGDEGGFAPPVHTPTKEPFDLLTQAIHNSGYTGRVKLAMDAAASELYDQDGLYDLEFKKPLDKIHKRITQDQLTEIYIRLVDEYPLISIEDPFDQDDFNSHGNLLAQVKNKTQIVGDDLLVTNVQRVQRAIDQHSANALLLKINQIGTITEAMQAAAAAQKAGWNVMVSHRSGETEDPFIADLAVGICAGQIKTGAPCRSERTSKYNQLLRIEEHAKDCKKHIKYGF